MHDQLQGIQKNMASKQVSKAVTEPLSLAERVDKELTCAICLSRYSDPKLLPCLHLYCKGCLEDLLKKSREKKENITCPQCQQVHELPESGIEGFNTYFTINNLLELLHVHEVTGRDKGDTILCESGLDEDENPQPAFARCLTCSQYLCKDCHSIHKRLKATKSHNVATLEEIKQSDKKIAVKSLQKKQYCEEHEDEAIKLFCNTCKKAICRDCALVKHREHDYTFARELRPKVQALLEKLMSAVQAKEIEYTSHKKYVENVRKLSKSALESCAKEVKEVYEKMVAQLEAHCSTLLSELNDIHEAEIKKIDAEESFLSLALIRFANSISFTRQLLDNGDDIELMSISSQTQETLESLAKMTWDKETLKPSLLRMKFNPEVTNPKTFGTVLHTIQSEEIIIKNLPEKVYVGKKVKFEVQLSSVITKKGYSASADGLSVKITHQERHIPVHVDYSGINSWMASFTPQNNGMHTISIVLEFAMCTKVATFEVLSIMVDKQVPDPDLFTHSSERRLEKDSHDYMCRYTDSSKKRVSPDFMQKEQQTECMEKYMAMPYPADEPKIDLSKSSPGKDSHDHTYRYTDSSMKRVSPDLMQKEQQTECMDMERHPANERKIDSSKSSLEKDSNDFMHRYTVTVSNKKRVSPCVMQKEQPTECKDKVAKSFLAAFEPKSKSSHEKDDYVHRYTDSSKKRVSPDLMQKEQQTECMDMLHLYPPAFEPKIDTSKNLNSREKDNRTVYSQYGYMYEEMQKEPSSKSCDMDVKPYSSPMFVSEKRREVNKPLADLADSSGKICRHSSSPEKKASRDKSKNTIVMASKDHKEVDNETFATYGIMAASSRWQHCSYNDVVSVIRSDQKKGPREDRRGYMIHSKKSTPETHYWSESAKKTEH